MVYKVSYWLSDTWQTHYYKYYAQVSNVLVNNSVPDHWQNLMLEKLGNDVISQFNNITRSCRLASSYQAGDFIHHTNFLRSTKCFTDYFILFYIVNQNAYCYSCYYKLPTNLIMDIWTWCWLWQCKYQFASVDSLNVLAKKIIYLLYFTPLNIE